MERDTVGGILAASSIAILAALFFGGGFASGAKHATNHIKREAVKAGVAEFVATKDGEVEFKWRMVK